MAQRQSDCSQLAEKLDGVAVLESRCRSIQFSHDFVTHCLSCQLSHGRLPSTMPSRAGCSGTAHKRRLWPCNLPWTCHIQQVQALHNPAFCMILALLCCTQPHQPALLQRPAALLTCSIGRTCSGWLAAHHTLPLAAARTTSRSAISCRYLRCACASLPTLAAATLLLLPLPASALKGCSREVQPMAAASLLRVLVRELCASSTNRTKWCVQLHL